jgi:hypothetical protein
LCLDIGFHSLHPLLTSTPTNSSVSASAPFRTSSIFLCCLIYLAVQPCISPFKTVSVKSSRADVYCNYSILYTLLYFCYSTPPLRACCLSFCLFTPPGPPSAPLYSDHRAWALYTAGLCLPLSILSLLNITPPDTCTLDYSPNNPTYLVPFNPSPPLLLASPLYYASKRPSNLFFWNFSSSSIFLYCLLQHG